MFENISSLSDLNKERQRLVKEGNSIPQVNSAYNQAKRKLMEDTPKYRKIARHQEPSEPKAILYNILSLQCGQVAANEIYYTERGVLI